MRNDLIQFVQVEADLFRCHCCRLCQCVGGELVHLSAVLQHGVFPALRTCSDAVIIFCPTLRLHKGRLRQCTVGIEELCTGAVCTQMAGVQSIFLVLDDCRCGTVPEENAGRTVTIVGDLGKALVCNNQCIPHGGIRFQEAVCGVHGIDKAGACRIHIKACRIGCTGFPLNDAGHRRGAVLRCNGGVDQQTDLQRIDACRSNSTLGSFCPHVPCRLAV